MGTQVLEALLRGQPNLGSDMMKQSFAGPYSHIPIGVETPVPLRSPETVLMNVVFLRIINGSVRSLENQFRTVHSAFKGVAFCPVADHLHVDPYAYRGTPR
ncbi:MAG: hypothetical protein JWM11_359 [Planctomycetaceae bacterium]|nr:hypothetical protein [Planctomycetaceae bacterium]